MSVFDLFVVSYFCGLSGRLVKYKHHVRRSGQVATNDSFLNENKYELNFYP